MPALAVPLSIIPPEKRWQCADPQSTLDGLRCFWNFTLQHGHFASLEHRDWQSVAEQNPVGSNGRNTAARRKNANEVEGIGPAQREQLSLVALFPHGPQ